MALNLLVFFVCLIKIKAMFKFLSLICLSLVLFACGNDLENRSVKDRVSAFLNNNNNIVSFGSMRPKDILDKAEYKTVPKFGALVSTVWDKYQNSLNLNSPVFYAVEGPFDTDGNPASSYFFIDVKNADSLQKQLKSQGFDFDKKDKIDYFQLNEVSFGIKQNMAVLIVKGGSYDGAKLLADIYAQSEGDLAEGKIDELLQKSDDLVANLNIKHLYTTSNTELSKLSKDKQSEINAMVTDAFITTSVRFEKGKIIVESKNIFPDALKKHLIFNEDASASITKKLGKGTPKFALATNIDMVKFQKFMDEFAPGAIEKFAADMGGEFQAALMLSGSDGLGGLMTGEIGIAMFGEPKAGSFIPDVNAFVGIGKNGSFIANMAQMFLSNGTAKSKFDGKGLYVASNGDLQGNGINVPSGCEIFGKKGITAFIDVEKLDLSKISFDEDMDWVKAIKYITFEYDNSGGKMVVYSKEGQENILKTAKDFAVKKFSNRISGLSL